MSGSVSSFEATVTCTAPTTSSSGLVSSNLWVSTGSASLGAAGGGGASTSGAGVGTGCEPIRAQLVSTLQPAARATSDALRPANASGLLLSVPRLTRSILEEYRLIGQFVRPRAASRKMLPQQPRHPGHRSAGSFRIAPGAVPCFDLAAHGLPLGLAHARTDTAVGEDFHCAIGAQHVDQYAVVVVCVPDAQMREYLHRACARRHVVPQRRRMQRGFDHEADFARVLPFGSADRRLDLRQHRR